MGYRLDIAGLIILIYGVSSLFSILMYSVGLRIDASSTYYPTIGATFFYCCTIFICLIPFMKYSNLRFLKIEPGRNDGFFTILGWAAFIWFLMTLFIDINAIIQVLTGDMSAIRAALYEGDRLIYNDASKVPFVIRAPWTLFNYVFKCSWVMIFLAFYVRFVEKMPWKYFVFFILASTVVLMESIIGVDRSKVAYWLIGIGANYLFFKNYMGARERKITTNGLMVLVGLSIFYLSMMTNARFGDRTYDSTTVEGSLGGLLIYLGQPYPNFCFFFDNFECKWSTMACIFPTFYYMFLPDEPSGLVPIQKYLDNFVSYRTGVFYTFIGAIMIMAGKWIAILFSTLFSVVSYKVLGEIKRKPNSIFTLYIYYALGSILLLGLFAYYYAEPILDMSVILTFIILKIFLKKQ